MSNLSREARIYLALWRRTATMPEGFPIKFASTSLAIAARQGLYRAIKNFRGRPDLDPILSEASDKFVVSHQPGETVIRFRPRQTLEALELQLEDLGIDELDLLTHSEKAAQGSLDKLLTKLSPESAPSTRSTPFFTRED